MPGVWNINSVYNTGAKKLSSKLTFEVGEKFSGRVVKLNKDKGELSIKLSDGWQFTAQVDEELTPEQLDGLLKFEVIGFQDGKLKLKLVKQNGGESNSEKDPLYALIKSKGLPKEEIETLKQLVKFNIPLTKENIDKYSSMLNFSEKIKINEKEGENFIENYIASKNIYKNSEEATLIKEKLQGFLKEFKSMTSDDILTFIENDIDMTEDNIKAFNRIFKGNESIEKVFLKAPIDGKIIEDTFLNEITNQDNSDKLEIINKDIKSTIHKEAYTSSNQEKKIDILDILKKMSGNFDETYNNKESKNLTSTNNIIKENFNKELMKVSINTYLQENGINDESIIDKNVKDLVDILRGRGININNKDILDLKNVFTKTIEENKAFNEVKNEEKKIDISDMLKKISNDFNDIKNIGQHVENINKEIIEESISSYLKENNVTKGELTNKNVKELVDILKSQGINVSDEEVLDIKNIFSKEIEENRESQSTIIKNEEKKIRVLDMVKNITDSLSDLGKIEDSHPIKLAQNIDMNGTIKEIIKSSVSSYLRENNTTINEFTNKDVKEFIEELKNQGVEVREKDIVEIKNSIKLEESNFVQAKDLSSNINKTLNEVVKEMMKEKTLEIKDIIKEILVSTKDSNEQEGKFNKIIEFIKGNTNEVKIFNSLSNNYYYMDVPLKIKDNQYDCKLIIKDERGKGKKLDSTNVKMVISLKTINLGNIDAYLKIQNKNLNIDLKCSKEYVKILEKEKNRLIDILNAIGYDTKIDVSKAVEEANISTTREFFNSGSLVILDRKV